MASSEGKRMSDSSNQCGSCQASSSTKYCADCDIPLCSMCSNFHKNIPATRDHNLSDLQLSTGSSKPVITKGKCLCHKGQVLTQLCKDCVQLLCDSCNADHAGHELLPLSDDPKVYHKICGKHIQQLIEDLHEIEELKAVLEGHITTYDEAVIVVDKWEQDLLKMIQNKADKLRRRIKQLKDEKLKLLGDKVKGLTGKLQEIDRSISMLTDIRKSMDTGILANELSKSQELIRKLKSYRSELSSVQPAPSVDQILPHGDKIKDVDDTLDVVFSMDRTASAANHQASISHRTGPQPVAEWIFTPAHRGKDVSQYCENPMTLTNVEYGPGPDGRPDTAIILPADDSGCVAVMNPNHRLRFNREMTYFTEVHIGANYGYLFVYRREPGTRVIIFPDCRRIRIDGVGDDVVINNAITPNNWYKIAVTVDKTSVSVYINGKHVETKTGSFNLSATKHEPLYMGRYPNDSWKPDCRMTRAKFYNVALSESEIQNL